MLRKFAVANYKNFKDRIELDLTNTRNYEFNSFALRNGVIKDAIIYGPNGCGKSNLGYAIFNIVNHLTQKTKQVEKYVNAQYGGKNDNLTYYEYEFDFSGHIITYVYAKDCDDKLKEESLISDGVMAFKKQQNDLTVDRSQFDLTENVLEMLKDNSNAISLVNYLAASYPLPEGHYINSLLAFANSMLWFRSLENRGFMGLMTGSVKISEYIISNGLVEDFSTFLKVVSGQKYEFVNSSKEDKHLLCRINGHILDFIDVMSTGTSSLMFLYFWIKQLEKVSLLFIDEFDAYYHFELAAEVCRQLFRKDCQVILTSHNTYLMSNDLLRPDCNFIISDGKIKPLSECTTKDLRFGHNIEKLSRGGAFS